MIGLACEAKLLERREKSMGVSKNNPKNTTN